MQGYGDDSAEMQTTNGGTPTINLVVPVRYTHAHNGIVNRGDFDQMVDLVVALLMKLDQQDGGRIARLHPAAMTRSVASRRLRHGENFSDRTPGSY